MDAANKSLIFFVVTCPYSSLTVAQDQFECSEGGKTGLGPVCLWESAVCDGERDCPEGEDELNCSKHGPCAPHPASLNSTSLGGGAAEASYYRCLRSEGCFLATKHCDGHSDCADGWV